MSWGLRVFRLFLPGWSVLFRELLRAGWPKTSPCFLGLAVETVHGILPTPRPGPSPHRQAMTPWTSIPTSRGRLRLAFMPSQRRLGFGRPRGSKWSGLCQSRCCRRCCDRGQNPAPPTCCEVLTKSSSHGGSNALFRKELVRGMQASQLFIKFSVQSLNTSTVMTPPRYARA